MFAENETPRETLAGRLAGHYSHDGTCKSFLQAGTESVKPDLMESFRQEAEANGLRPTEILPDGDIHRCPIDGKPGQKDGAYYLHLDRPANGGIWNWREQCWHKWWSEGVSTLTDADRAKLQQQSEARRLATAKLQAEARDKAEKYLSNLSPVPDSSPYLQSKGVQPAGPLCVDGADLIVPLFDELGRVQTFQRIMPNGEKRFHPGGKVKGGHFPICDRQDGPLYIVEGVATGLSIYEATGDAVECAFNAGNLKPVAEILRGKYPDRKIIIAGDNDQRTAGNPGRTKAEDAARLIDAMVVVPLFVDRTDLSDFNDLHQAMGIDEVVEQLSRASYPGGCQEKTPFETFGVGELTASEPKERKFVVDNLIAESIVGVLAAPGGTGKSIWLLSLAMHVAAGRPFFGYDISRPRGVLICSAEDDVEEVQRRTYAIRMAAMYDGEPFSDVDLDRVQIADLVGATEEIVTMDGNNAVINEMAVNRIVETANGIDDLGLIVLDPVSRFRSGGENDSGAATCFVKALEIVRKATGAAVIVAHHSRKGATGESADDIRGSSALVDACRWAATLSNLLPKEAQGKYAMDEIERKSLVKFKVVKENYTAPTDEVWLQRGNGGVLRNTHAPTPQKELRSNTDYENFLHGLDGLIREAGGITRRKLRNYAGVDGPFGMGEKKIKQFVDRGIREDRIHLDPGGCMEVTASGVVS